MEKKKKTRGRPKGSTSKPKVDTAMEDLWSIPANRRVDLSEVDITSLKFPLKAIYMGYGKATIYSIKNFTPTSCLIDATWLNESFHNGLMSVKLFDVEIEKP